MAIVTIDNLPVADSVSTGDTLIINTATGAKQIDASAVGGTSNVEIIEFEISGSTISTVLTAGQIKALVTAGKTLIGKTSPMSGVIVTVNISFFNTSDNGMSVFYVAEGNLVSLELTASTDNDVLEGEIGG